MDIPVSLNDLDSVVYNVSRDLIEQRAINGQVDEFTAEMTQAVVEDVAFVINRYMHYINEIMSTDKLDSAESLQTKLEF